MPPQAGQLKEQSLQALLRELAADNPGLCLVTSRLPLLDVQAFQNRTVREIQLDALSDEAGAALLKSLGVRGPASELESASREKSGHPFSLNLLGTYLVDACDGDVRRRHELPAEESDHARNLIALYEKWLGESAEVQILRVLGLLSGPATPDAIEALRTPPAIIGLTDHLVGKKRADWNRITKRLRALKLLSEPALGSDDDALPEPLKTHQLVRQHFAEQLKANFPVAWLEGNSRMFDYYRHAAPHLPETLDQMMPLFHAVAHGCRAGRREEAWSEVHWPRVRRGDDGFAAIVLGAYGLELTAIANFFDVCWDRPARELSPSVEAVLLCEAGFNLRGVGRLEEAADVQRAGLQAQVAVGQWRAAANAAGNLSEVLVVLGRLDDAARDARTSIELAERGGDDQVRATNLATLGDALHQSGNVLEAQRCFEKAEALAAHANAETRFLHALRGFHYCDLLLELGKFEEVLTRASYILEVDGRLKLTHGTGLAHLAIARAQFGLSGRGGLDAGNVERSLQLSIKQLKDAGHEELVVRALLTITDLRRSFGELDLAQEALDEALAGAARGQMKLYIADAHLQNAFLLLDRGDTARARGACKKARLLVEQMGYLRRMPSIRALEQSLAAAT